MEINQPKIDENNQPFLKEKEISKNIYTKIIQKTRKTEN